MVSWNLNTLAFWRWWRTPLAHHLTFGEPGSLGKKNWPDIPVRFPPPWEWWIFPPFPSCRCETPFDLASLAKEERLGNWFAREQWSKSWRLEWNKQRWQRHLLWQLGRKPGPASLFSPIVLCCYSYIFDCFNFQSDLFFLVNVETYAIHGCYRWYFCSANLFLQPASGRIHSESSVCCGRKDVESCHDPSRKILNMFVLWLLCRKKRRIHETEVWMLLKIFCRDPISETKNGSGT